MPEQMKKKDQQIHIDRPGSPIETLRFAVVISSSINWITHFRAPDKLPKKNMYAQVRPTLKVFTTWVVHQIRWEYYIAKTQPI
jgi:hypothetical protein